MPASTILLIEADQASGETIAPVLSGVGYSVTTSEPADAFGKVADHQLVIIDVVTGEKSAADVCREIRATPALAQIPVLCVSQSDEVEDRIRFLEAGADDVMAKPFDARELEARVEALLLRFQRSKDISAVVSTDGVTVARVRRTVTVHSPKGGVGTTTVATNVAMAAAQRKPDRVVIVDLDLQFGQVATHLNVTPRQTLADVVRDEAAQNEPELLRTYATRHDSGLHVLAAPGGPEQAALVTAEHIDRILTTLLDSYDQVVIDTGSFLDERTLATFEHADSVLFVVNPEIAALKAVAALVEYLNEAGTVAAKTEFVVNNTFAREILKLRDVESALGTKIATELPYDGFLYLKAVNEGVPIVQGAARSVAADRLSKLSVRAFGADGIPAAAIAGADDKKAGGRFSFRRR
ncbi:MAG TPA: AAA family ATPase [Candidatus Limnocylindrales bacterium]|nr:AAA family ATPase [Candidatus Limnocylindrales bacterium]